jgi:serine phosphatase RsbU (regulator of sigma subunit)
MGLFNSFECQVVEKQLAAGDILIMYSDGLTEAMNAEGEEFGEDRLLEIAGAQGHLSPPFLGDKIVEAAKRFPQAEQADDVTLIVARCCA